MDKDTQELMELYESMTFDQQGHLTSTNITTKEGKNVLIKMDYDPSTQKWYITTSVGMGVTGKNWMERKELRIPVKNPLEGFKQIEDLATKYQKQGLSPVETPRIPKY
jgi:hypothetical protein